MRKNEKKKKKKEFVAYGYIIIICFDANLFFFCCLNKIFIFVFMRFEYQIDIYL